MKCTNRLVMLIPFLALSGFTAAQIDPELVRTAQRSVCAISIYGDQTNHAASLGCGVVLMNKIKGRNVFFVATAYHIIRELTDAGTGSATFHIFDKNGQLFKAKDITGKYIVWVDRHMDAALVVIPGNLEPVGSLPDNYQPPGPASLKLIGDPNWGEDIYLFGYRWLNENRFIDILKKGILSVGTNELPGYEGHLVYLIDNMANKGMSGGLAFTADGKGIGVISSYVYETNNPLLSSDDLTVCLPLSIYFNIMGSLVINQEQKILKLVGN